MAASNNKISMNCLESLYKSSPFEFENWAVIALGGIPNKMQVGDMGIAASRQNAAI